MWAWVKALELHAVPVLTRTVIPCCVAQVLHRIVIIPTLFGRCSTAYLYLTWQVLHRIVSPERVEYARDQSCGLQVNTALEPILT